MQPRAVIFGLMVLFGAIVGLVELLEGPEIDDEREARALVVSFLGAGLIRPESLEILDLETSYDPGWRFYELIVRLEAANAAGEIRSGILKFKVEEWSGKIPNIMEVSAPPHRLMGKDGVFIRDEHGNIMLRVPAPDN